MNIIGTLICFGYFIIAFIILFILDKRSKNFSKEERRRIKYNSGVIFCSVFWLPILIVVIFVVFLSRIFDKEE